ncbi:MAG: helix-turn-helix domain-containing protein [Glaciimonas sp.]|nr:helix-turn-helix domain-containing protein [Glaciimonas sp.]
MNSHNSRVFRPSPTSAITHGDEGCFILTEAIIGDADYHAASLQHWKQEYEQISNGVFSSSLDEVWFGNVQLFREKTNQVLHQTGLPWDGSRTIGVTLDATGDGLFSGTMLDSGSLFTLGGGESLDFLTPKKLDIIAVSTDATALQEFSLNIWGIDIEAGLTVPGVLKHALGTAQCLSEFLALLLNNIKDAPGMLNYPQIRKIVEQEIYNNLVMATSGATVSDHHAFAASRKNVVDKAKAYVLEHHDDPVTIPDLCLALNISRRTLQYSFESVLDINPVAYLKAIRLNRVRRAIKDNAGAAHTTLADIAARWGFWHSSKFSANYKAMFGELPSETLRKSR